MMGFAWLGIAVILICILVLKMVSNSRALNDEQSLELYGGESFRAGDVKALQINLVSESILIEETDGDAVKVDFRGEGWPNKKLPTINLENGVLVIKAVKQFGVSFNFRETQVVVEIPSSVMNNPDFNVNAVSISGSAKIKGIECNALNVSDTSGSVYVSGAKVNHGNLISVSGSVKFEGSAEKLDCESVSGSILLNGEFGQFNLKSVSGSVKVTSPKPLSADSSIKTTSGSIKVDMPQNSAVRLDCVSKSGSVKLQ